MKQKKLDFWKIIEDCRWADDFNDERIKAYLINKYNKEERNKITEFARKKVKKLYKVLDKYSFEKTGCNYSYFLQDDSGDDLRCHIVGLGKKEFEAVIENPELARERGRKRDYQENFLYSFHFDDIEY